MTDTEIKDLISFIKEYLYVSGDYEYSTRIEGYDDLAEALRDK